MKLLIVESAAESKTIEAYLGSEYHVEASMGHIRDLSIKGKGGFGVDINNNFKPEYVILDEKKAVVQKLIDYAENAEHIYLATDPDREGDDLHRIGRISASGQLQKEIIALPQDQASQIQRKQLITVTHLCTKTDLCLFLWRKNSAEGFPGIFPFHQKGLNTFILRIEVRCQTQVFHTGCLLHGKHRFRFADVLCAIVNSGQDMAVKINHTIFSASFWCPRNRSGSIRHSRDLLPACHQTYRNRTGSFRSHWPELHPDCVLQPTPDLW